MVRTRPRLRLLVGLPHIPVKRALSILGPHVLDNQGLAVLGLGVIVGPVVADLKYLTRKYISLPLSRARISPESPRAG
jgi:hypothetical protein